MRSDVLDEPLSALQDRPGERRREASTHLAWAFTFNDEQEEIGVPVAVSFTLTADARVHSGSTLVASIELVDAATDGSVEFVGDNCSHPTEFAPALTQPATIEEFQTLLDEFVDEYTLAKTEKRLEELMATQNPADDTLLLDEAAVRVWIAWIDGIDFDVAAMLATTEPQDLYEFHRAVGLQLVYTASAGNRPVNSDRVRGGHGH